MYRCEERNTRDVLLSVLGCLPPLLSSQQDEERNLTCESEMKFEKTTYMEYVKTYFNIMNSQACLHSCSSIDYTTKIKNVERIYYTAVVMMFTEEVREVQQRLQHSALSFLTTLGGHIGVCRTLLWGLLALLGLHAVLPANVKAMLIA